MFVYSKAGNNEGKDHSNGIQGAMPTHYQRDEQRPQHRDAMPDFRPGDILTHADLEKIRPFLPPGYVEKVDFPGVEFTISETGDYAPHPVFLAATEQYTGQTKLADDGAMVDYKVSTPTP